MIKKVSVIIPMYNAENTIEKCIKSIINQSHKNIEMIIVDDGSNDSSSEKVKIFGDKIKYIYQTNKGVSEARNRGIIEATGEYILFVDSDDCIEEDFVEKTLFYAETNHIDMVVARHTEENATIYGGNKNCENTFLTTNDSDIVEHFKSIHIGQAVGKLYKTQMIKEHEIKFPKEMSLAEDFYFVSEVLLYTNKVGLVDNTYYRIFNVNVNSLSKKYIDNIQLGINMQLDIWSRLNERYNGLDIAYAKEDMDYKLHKVKMFANNLFKKESTCSYMNAVKEISKFIHNSPELFCGNVPIKYCPNNIRKVESVIVKCKMAFIIAAFYYIKERIKTFRLWKIKFLKKGISNG